MSDTRLDVFIQNLKDTTTVLQQLELCIKNLKENLVIVDNMNEVVTELETKVMHKYKLTIANNLVTPTKTWIFEFYTTDDNVRLSERSNAGILEIMQNYGYTDGNLYGMLGVEKAPDNNNWNIAMLYFVETHSRYYTNTNGVIADTIGLLYPNLEKLY